MVKVAFVAAAVAAGVAVASGEVAAATGGEAARGRESLRHSVMKAETTDTTAPFQTRTINQEGRAKVSLPSKINKRPTTSGVSRPRYFY